MMLSHKDMTQEIVLLPITAQQLLIKPLLAETRLHSLELEQFTISNILWSSASSQWLRV